MTDKEVMQQALEAQIENLMRAADSYAHVYAFVGDDTMPKMRAALEAGIRAAIAQPEQPATVAQAGQSEPEAWSVYCEIEGVMVMQYPMCMSRESAEQHSHMYSTDVKKEIRPLYTHPAP